MTYGTPGRSPKNNRREPLLPRWERLVRISQSWPDHEAPHLRHRIVHPGGCVGELRNCSRRKNRELFQLAIGGYGLFGVVYSITLRLVPRRKLQRVVEVLNVDDVMPAFTRRIQDGFLYGDFQFAIDPASQDFLRRGIFSCYRPVRYRDTDYASQEALHERLAGSGIWRARAAHARV